MVAKRNHLQSNGSRISFLRTIFMSSVLLLAGRCQSVKALSSTFSRAGRRYVCNGTQRHERAELHAFRFQRQRPYSSSGRSRHGESLWATATDDDEVEGYAKTIESEWSVPGLKKEVGRLVLRCHKKVGKASQRLFKAKATYDQLNSNDSASLEELEQCPDLDALEYELTELQSRLRQLNTLEENLKSIKAKSDAILPEDVASLAVDLGVDDQPAAPKPRGVTKPKGPRVSEAHRLPYRRYYSFGGVEIRVGKQAEDNDELTCSPLHRDGADWWMHAAGCPGSHVVIRSHDQQLPEEVVQDAAALAARQSKCNTAVIKVSLTRCRDITKPPGAKAGLVMLTGQVRSVSVNMKEATSRLQRLDATVLVN